MALTTAKLNSLFLMTGIVFFSLISLLILTKLVKIGKRAWKDLDREEEGFADSAAASADSAEGKDGYDKKKKVAFNPDEFSYHMLKNAMVSIRKASKHILDPKAFMERISMSRMTPTELARKYIAENKNKE